MFNTIQLSKSSSSPLYLQLANGLAQLIETSQLPSGTKLPSIRFLAKELRINRDTVVSAYKILEQRGLTYGQTGRGTYVSPLPSLPTLTPLPLEPFSLTHKDLINFSSITLPNDYFPIEILVETISNVLSAENWNAFYDYHGTKSGLLLEEVCNYLKEYSVQSYPNQVRMVQNTSQLFQLLPRLMSKPGICVESPCKDVAIFKEYGFELFEVSLDQDGMNLDSLEAHLKTGKIQYIYVTPYLQNPTGICYSDQRKQQLLALAKSYNIYIIENDVFSDLLIGDLEYIPLYALSLYKNVIYVKHFSQLYLPNLHYSFVVLPNTLSNINIRPYPYNFTDSIFYSFLYNKMWQISKQLLIEHYHTIYLKLCDLIDLHLSPYISYTCAFGGIYIWLTLSAPQVSLEDFCDELIANQILVSPGSLFFTHDVDCLCLRLSIAKTSMAQIERGIKVMASILAGSY